jgi:hypothetical protein
LRNPYSTSKSNPEACLSGIAQSRKFTPSQFLVEPPTTQVAKDQTIRTSNDQNIKKSIVLRGIGSNLGFAGSWCSEIHSDRAAGGLPYSDIASAKREFRIWTCRVWAEKIWLGASGLSTDPHAGE